MIVCIYYRTLDLQVLFIGKISYGYVMRLDLLRIMFIQKSIDHVLLRERHYIQMILVNDFIKVKVDRDEAGYSFNSS